jgi:hypothetical protein
VDIIENENLKTAKVYRSPSKMADISDHRNEESMQFMNYCMNTVLEFIS